jgi:hypothetical protein
MKHERASAEAVCADFEPGAIRREWVRADSPLKRSVGGRVFKVVISVVEYDFEQPFCSRLGHRPVAREDWKVRGVVPVFDAFEIPID